MTVSMTNTVHVLIENDRTTALAFLKWSQEENVFPSKRGGAVGPDFVSHVYDAKDSDRIQEFFKSQGVRVTTR